MIFTDASQIFKQLEMYNAVKNNKTNIKIYFVRKTKYGKLIIFNGKLITMY